MGRQKKNGNLIETRALKRKRRVVSPLEFVVEPHGNEAPRIMPVIAARTPQASSHMHTWFHMPHTAASHTNPARAQANCPLRDATSNARAGAASSLLDLERRGARSHSGFQEAAAHRKQSEAKPAAARTKAAVIQLSAT